MLLRTGKKRARFTFSWSTLLSDKQGGVITKLLEEWPLSIRLHFPLMVSTLHFTPALVVWSNTRDYTITANLILRSALSSLDPDWLHSTGPPAVFFLLDVLWDTGMQLWMIGNMAALCYIAYSLWDLTAKWDTSMWPELLKSAISLAHRAQYKMTGRTFSYCSCPALPNFISSVFCTCVYFLYFF
ncbi:hypothetical protein GQ53DRAFT_433221 [Thozetella sp. PMI_491]|nr:hypothetical protein GQ53DRAFT_433221 [Thozetella sp. PMI_491]